MKDTFISLLESTKRQGVYALLAWLEQNTDFYTAPASTKYHGNYEGGLLEHSLDVYRHMLELTKGDHNISTDSLIIVSLLHDLCKINFYEKYQRNVKEDGVWKSVDAYRINDQNPFADHGDKSVIYAMEFITLTEDEIAAIRGHMGGFDNATKGGAYYLSNLFAKYPLAVYLHLADIKATYLNHRS